MKKLLTLGASSSRSSINKQLANWAANQVNGATINLIDLNDYEMPIFSVDKEKENGHPEAAERFKQAIREADGIIISFAEHNGSYSSAFKNVLDWTSRIERSMWLDKPMFLMATSPGGRGGATVLGSATGYFPHMKANVAASFSLPSFYDNFSAEAGITNAEHLATFKEQLAQFENALTAVEA